MSRKSFLDMSQDHPFSVEMRIVKSKFKPGDQVEVRLRHHGNWYRAKVMYSVCNPNITFSEDGVEFDAWHWEHHCRIADERVATVTATIYESANRSDYIRFPEA